MPRRAWYSHTNGAQGRRGRDASAGRGRYPPAVPRVLATRGDRVRVPRVRRAHRARRVHPQRGPSARPRSAEEQGEGDAQDVRADGGVAGFAPAAQVAAVLRQNGEGDRLGAGGGSRQDQGGERRRGRVRLLRRHRQARARDVARHDQGRPRRVPHPQPRPRMHHRAARSGHHRNHLRLPR